MSNYERYKDLLGIPYDDGDRDCYGLVRRFWLSTYGIEVPNYARSWTFFSDGIDLITAFLKSEDFVVVDTSTADLEVGDGLMFSVASRRSETSVNHLGVFVGNGTFIHHPLDKPSCEDYMNATWSRRLMGVVRHPDVAEMNARMLAARSIQFIDTVSVYAKQRLNQQAPGVLDASE